MTVRWFIRKSLRRPYSLVLVPFIAVVAAAGTSLSEEDSSTISRLLGEGVLGPALPADPIGEKAPLIPLVPATRIFRLSSAPNAGTTETDILRASEQEGSDATWQYAAGRRSIYHLSIYRLCCFIRKRQIRQGSPGKIGLRMYNSAVASGAISILSVAGFSSNSQRNSRESRPVAHVKHCGVVLADIHCFSPCLSPRPAFLATIHASSDQSISPMPWATPESMWEWMTLPTGTGTSLAAAAASRRLRSLSPSRSMKPGGSRLPHLTR